MTIPRERTYAVQKKGRLDQLRAENARLRQALEGKKKGEKK